jgi:23S rRNA pseudouridine1911/1915/1917 synthase
MARQALHAHALAFAHPTTQGRMRFEAPLPDDLARALAALR